MDRMEILRYLDHLLPGKAWVVGGAVRDRLLGRSEHDQDLVLDQAVDLLSPEHWQQQGVAAFWLDESRQMVRLPLAPHLDLAPLAGADLRADLGRRDFTVNALALPLTDWLRDDWSGLCDPYGGRADLDAKRLCLVAQDALQADPVRVLRAARLSVELDLQPDEGTIAALTAASFALAGVPAERVWAELAQILCHRAAPAGLAALRRWGAVDALFPEVAAMRQVEQNVHHQFTVDVHTEKAFAAFVEIIHHGSYLTGAARGFARRYWDDLSESKRAAVMLGVWLHDIGKPPTRVIREGAATFYGHEQVGAKLAMGVAERLRLGSDQSRLLQTLISLHMYPMQLWRTGHLDDRLIHRLYRRTGEVGVAVVLFTLADHLAKGDRVAESAEFGEHQQVVEHLLKTYYCRGEQVISPKPLLAGDDIVLAVGRTRGPWVGEVKGALLEAQAAGHVRDRQQALQFVKNYQPSGHGRRSK